VDVSRVHCSKENKNGAIMLNKSTAIKGKRNGIQITW